MEKESRNKKTGRRLWGLILAGVLGLSLSQTVFAGSKAISSVSVRVDSKLEPGFELPDIEIGSGSAGERGVKVSVSNSRYHVTEAEWVDSTRELETGDEPRMSVTLEPEDVSENYFLASYKKSSVSISGGTFVSARRDGDDLVVTLRVKPVKGDYEEPLDAFWYEDNLGVARWEKPDNTSGYYEVQLYRDGKSVYKVPGTSSLQYNFYPYMTKAGNYMFKVRTIPKDSSQSKYGGRSDWIESGELQITDRYVSDGKGQQKPGSNVVHGAKKPGWNKDGDTWRFYYPDGSLCSSRWEYIEGQWYYFNGDGVMQTGWLKQGEDYYYLYPNGQMAVGWASIDGKWYYFATGEDDGETAGVMAGPGWRVIGSYYYYFNNDGSMYTGWLLQNDKWYYLNTVENSLQGAMFTGWIKRDNQTYYADANGELVDGWCQIDGNWYYFYPDSKAMACSTTVDGFYVDQDGVWR
ncbi:MAG: N-acetylmuramoyl-L-alanine amidase family protein [Lachnospiraceae bacterium]